MATITNSLPRTPLHESAKELFGEHPDDVIGTIASGADRLFQLASLLRVIAASVPEHSDARRLASMGEYLAEDSGNLLDCQREQYSDAMMRAAQ